ncbi:MAG: cation-translocating P-type ATPase [Candidatus Omnitrophica bacterium]|nr:cation-translocating P-type ATPase [Candidatus Omnitrophota bacterium]
MTEGLLNRVENKLWHFLSVPEVLDILKGSSSGLEKGEAQNRLARFGPNVLISGKKRTAVGMFLGQFTDFMILVLLAAAIVSGLVGDVKDTIVIAAILFLNAVIGFVQEYRAEKAMEALKAMAAPTATVLREGKSVVISAAELVPGDTVLLEAGRIVPADLRLIEAARLRADEAALTGESVPVEKIVAPIEREDIPLGDRRNMAYKGTIVTYGRGTGIVVATGMSTEFGKIAALLQSAEEVKTPLQKRLAKFGKRLSITVLSICAIIFIAGIIRGEAPLLMFMTAVSLAVAAIPEALPAVVTISLALGAKKMAQKKALVRKLPAVETLGSVTYICTDKTGTLTMNRMRAEELYCDGSVEHKPLSKPPWNEFLKAMALCNDACTGDSCTTVGDPTEAALYEAAKESGIEKEKLEKSTPRVAELPFDSERKCMTTFHKNSAGGFTAFTKGAVEIILGKSANALTSAGVSPIENKKLLAISEKMAGDGLRVLALAVRNWDSLPAKMDHDHVENNLTLLGFVGIMDPPREEARTAVDMCRAAGIVPVMITGDHPNTARAIARRLGILNGDESVMTGTELSQIPLEDYEARVEKIRVYARVSPDQKLKIVTALQDRGEFVAMTGDGVNDAPALKRADIGVAMGVTGTDVAKEASSMILLDDNFATIVRAVKEGRRIYDNMRRFIRYGVTTNSAEVWIIFLAPFLGLPIPLLPIQILWINLLTDGLPGLALAAEPAEKNVMERPPRPPQEGVFAHGLGIHVIWVGIFMAALTLACEAILMEHNLAHCQSFIFTLVCISQLAHVLAIRSEHESLFTQGLFSNKPLLAAVIVTFLLQMATLYIPILNNVFKTQPLTALELAVCLAAASAVFFAVEIEKWLKRSFLLPVKD